jgi:hypothetical protein
MPGCELPLGPTDGEKGAVELAIDNEVDGERIGAVDRLTGGGKIVGDGGTVDTRSSFK